MSKSKPATHGVRLVFSIPPPPKARRRPGIAACNARSMQAQINVSCTTQNMHMTSASWFHFMGRLPLTVAGSADRPPGPSGTLRTLGDTTALGTPPRHPAPCLPPGPNPCQETTFSQGAVEINAVQFTAYIFRSVVYIHTYVHAYVHYIHRTNKIQGTGSREWWGRGSGGIVATPRTVPMSILPGARFFLPFASGNDPTTERWRFLSRPESVRDANGILAIYLLYTRLSRCGYSERVQSPRQTRGSGEMGSTPCIRVLTTSRMWTRLHEATPCLVACV